MIKFGGREYSQLIVLLYVCSNFLNRHREREREKEALLFRVIANRIATNFIYTLFGGNSKILRRTKRSKIGGWSCFFSPRRKFYLYLFPRKFLFFYCRCFYFHNVHTHAVAFAVTQNIQWKKRIEGQIGKKHQAHSFSRCVFTRLTLFCFLFCKPSKQTVRV